VNQKVTKPNINIPLEEKSYTFNKDVLNLFTLGNRRLASSLIWTKTLIDSDIVHVKNESKSWMFYKFDTIASLDPYFYENYLFGGIYLSIIKDDIYGAAEIFEKGLKHYPRDYQLLYNSGFNYYFEMGNKKKAMEKYNLLLDHPWSKTFTILPRLIARLAREEADDQVAFNFLYSSYTSMVDGVLKDRTADTLYALKAQIDLSCLNKGMQNCQKNDFRNNPYILKNGKYVAQEKWRAIKTKKRRK
jgi:tetratricopeptide (TPR) repeat protein